MKKKFFYALGAKRRKKKEIPLSKFGKKRRRKKEKKGIPCMPPTRRLWDPFSFLPRASRSMYTPEGYYFLLVVLAQSVFPDGTFKLTRMTNLWKKIVTFGWYSNDRFHYMFKAEFVTLVSLKVPSGSEIQILFLGTVLLHLYYIDGLGHAKRLAR